MVPAAELDDIAEDRRGRVYSRAVAAGEPNAVPVATPVGDAEGRSPAGVRVDGVIRRGFPTPSGRLEFYSRTLAEWGWPEHALPGYIRSHVHPATLGPDQMVLISTFRLPVQIHTRGGNAKWLNELAHTNPLWIHPRDAAGLGRHGGRPRPGGDRDRALRRQGVGHGRHPARGGRVQSPHGPLEARRAAQAPAPSGAAAARQVAATVDLTSDGGRWAMARRQGAAPYELGGPGHAAHLVGRCRGAPEPHLRRAARSDLGPALLAPGRTGAPRGTRRRLRRHRRRHRQGARRLQKLARQNPWRGRRTPRTAPAAPTGCCARSNRPRTPTGSQPNPDLMTAGPEVFRALGALCEAPDPAHAASPPRWAFPLPRARPPAPTCSCSSSCPTPPPT